MTVDKEENTSPEPVCEEAKEKREPDELKTEKSLDSSLIIGKDAADTLVSGETRNVDAVVRVSPPVSGDTERKDKPPCPYGTSCYR